MASMLPPPPPRAPALPDTETTTEVICSSTDVHQQSLEDVFAGARPHQLLVPLFQRRYCWGKKQWAALVSDVDASATAGIPLFLGRILAFVGPHDPRTLICDGQQRLISLSLLLAALRDAALAAGDAALAGEIDALIFMDAEARDAPALLPTHDDREAYASAIARPGEAPAKVDHSESGGQSITEARAFFDARIADLLQRTHPAPAPGAGPAEIRANTEDRLAKVRALVRATRSRTQLVRFGLAQGEELHRVFEQHASREAALKSIWNFDMPGMQIAGCDLIRNLVLSCVDEAHQVSLHESLWVEMEKHATGGSGTAFDLEAFFMAFLHAVGHSVTSRPELYAGFRDWLSRSVLAGVHADDAAARTEAVRGALELMLAESKKWEERVHAGNR